ncbi:hypothetical protein AMTRI_Chr08g163480 [Amborella trichopoda]
MVLSNKKLKQKLRAALAVSAGKVAVAESAGKAALHHPQLKPNAENETKFESGSFMELLGSVSKRPTSSKRGKRREKAASHRSAPVESMEEAQQVGKEEHSFSLVVNSEKMSKKKRKRNGDGSVDNGAAILEDKSKSEEEEKNPTNNMKKKKNKKEKRKKMKKKNELANPSAAEEAKDQTLTDTKSQENFGYERKVYVGGIPYYSSEDDIRSFFEGCGTITEVDCMSFPESGKFRGIVIITFKVCSWGGLFLKVQPYRASRAEKVQDFVPARVDGYNRIYAGNLSWDITEQDLRALFSDCKIWELRFGMDKESGEFRGYAHVDFEDNVSLEVALTLDQTVVCGRPIKIRCAVPKKGGSSNPEKRSEKKESGPSLRKASKKRRTCYECGTAGHLSSSCPKKMVVESNIPV